MTRTRVAEGSSAPVVAGFVLPCPHCHEPYPDPQTGMRLYTSEEAHARIPVLVTCAACGGLFCRPVALPTVRYNGTSTTVEAGTEGAG